MYTKFFTTRCHLSAILILLQRITLSYNSLQSCAPVWHSCTIIYIQAVKKKTTIQITSNSGRLNDNIMVITGRYNAIQIFFMNDRVSHSIKIWLFKKNTSVFPEWPIIASCTSLRFLLLKLYSVGHYQETIKKQRKHSLVSNCL